jgi:Amt family ammonium transporter
VVTWILLKLTDGLVGLRLDENSEVAGLDISSHEERGYNFTS